MRTNALLQSEWRSTSTDRLLAAILVSLAVALTSAPASAQEVKNDQKGSAQKTSAQKTQKTSAQKTPQRKTSERKEPRRQAVERSPRQGGARGEPPNAAEHKRRSAQRERWARLPENKRKQLEAIYRQLEKLPPDKRQLLLERLRRLDSDTRRERLRSAKKRVESEDFWLESQSRQTRRRLLESLPTKVRERLQALPVKERQKHIRQLMANRRKKLLDKLPPEVAKEIRALPPGKQTLRLKQYRTNQILRRTFQNEQELQRLRTLPPRELRRLLTVKDTDDAAAKKPEYLSVRTWRRWKGLERYERERILRQLRSSGAHKRPAPQRPPQRPRPSRKQRPPPADGQKRG